MFCNLMLIVFYFAQGDQDFPASSVKAFHEKTPTPANEFRPVHKKNAIQQPKKM